MTDDPIANYVFNDNQNSLSLSEVMENAYHSGRLDSLETTNILLCDIALSLNAIQETRRTA